MWCTITTDSEWNLTNQIWTCRFTHEVADRINTTHTKETCRHLRALCQKIKRLQIHFVTSEFVCLMDKTSSHVKCAHLNLFLICCWEGEDLECFVISVGTPRRPFREHFVPVVCSCTRVYPKVSGLSHNEIKATINTHWETSQRVMAAKLTRLTNKIVI
jgi:hypothetical protein